MPLPDCILWYGLSVPQARTRHVYKTRLLHWCQVLCGLALSLLLWYLLQGSQCLKSRSTMLTLTISIGTLVATGLTELLTRPQVLSVTSPSSQCTQSEDVSWARLLRRQRAPVHSTKLTQNTTTRDTRSLAVTTGRLFRWDSW